MTNTIEKEGIILANLDWEEGAPLWAIVKVTELAEVDVVQALKRLERKNMVEPFGVQGEKMWKKRSVRYQLQSSQNESKNNP